MLAEIFSEWGIIILVVAVVILFGSTQLPKFARSLGSAQSEFKKGLADGSTKDGSTKDGDTKDGSTKDGDTKDGDTNDGSE